jgi:AcrR family transcriptional regulator
MNRLPIEQRRDQLVAAALAVATRDGLERTTMRAIAAEAGVALGVLHYCFTDKAEIMRAVARHIHTQGLNVALAAAGGGDPEALVEHVVTAYAGVVTGAREQYLLQYELTVAALRDPELSGLAAEQLSTKLANARIFLEVVGPGAGLTWAVPVDDVARRLVVAIDGAVLAWLVDHDDRTLRSSLATIGRAVRTLGELNERRSAELSPLP